MLTYKDTEVFKEALNRYLGNAKYIGSFERGYSNNFNIITEKFDELFTSYFNEVNTIALSIDADKKIVAHVDDLYKFQRSINLQDTNEIKISNQIFLGGVVFRRAGGDNISIKTPIKFVNCTFNGNIDFGERVNLSELHFNSCTFEKRLSISNNTANITKAFTIINCTLRIFPEFTPSKIPQEFIWENNTIISMLKSEGEQTACRKLRSKLTEEHHEAYVQELFALEQRGRRKELAKKWQFLKNGEWPFSYLYWAINNYSLSLWKPVAWLFLTGYGGYLYFNKQWAPTLVCNHDITPIEFAAINTLGPLKLFLANGYAELSKTIVI